MHDPMTVAFTVKYPWHWWAKSYKTPLATIWHCDPERGGDLTRRRHVVHSDITRGRRDA